MGLDVGAIGCISLSALVRAEGTLLNIRINFSSLNKQRTSVVKRTFFKCPAERKAVNRCRQPFDILIMQVFKTDRKLFWTNELKNWALTIVFATTLYYVFWLFSSPTTDNLLVGIVVLFLLKIAETLTPYHVTAIEIDRQTNHVTFKLYSLMSGDKVRKYELRQVRSELILHSGIAKLLSSPVTLKVLLMPKDTFRITSRYGFSRETLISVDNVLKSLSASVATP